MKSTDIALRAFKNLSVTAGTGAGCSLWLLDSARVKSSIIQAAAGEVITVPATAYHRAFSLDDESDGYAAFHITDAAMPPDADAVIAALGFAPMSKQAPIFPDADPGVAGAWWDNAGTLTKSIGGA